MRNKRIASVLVALAGWYGSSAIIAGYAFLTLGGLSSDSTLFLLLNLTGAIGLLIVSLAKKVISLLVLNAFWMFVAIIGFAIR